MSKTTTESASSSQAQAASSAQQGPSSTAGARAKAPWELPFAMPMPDGFAQIVRDQIARTQAVMGELASYEAVAVQRARASVDELARLTTDSIGYMSQLAAEWRKLSIDTMQRTAEAFAPRA